MERLIITVLFGIGLATNLLVCVEAKAAPLYDMDAFLSESHPFASPSEPPYFPTPSAQQTVGGSVKVAQPTTSPLPTEPVVASSERKGKWGIVSEVRGGILKHALAFGHDAKEKGIDGNIEVLFISPDMFEVIWSPRPHIGASFNASDDDTDQIYAGLTWEWKPVASMFVDFSFGFAVHNGNLSNDNGTMGAVPNPDETRRREFGCEVLFRESLELGYRFNVTHSLSLIWDHVSHGGLCNSENEGMDNAGLRYGYRF